MSADNIPQELRDLQRWCRWHIAQNEHGRATKVPFHPNHDPSDLSQGRFASNKATPYSFDDVANTGPIDGEQGVGFVLRGGVQNKRGEHIVALDLDCCRNCETGELTPWAQAVVDTANSYTEVSPSGFGVRVFLTTSEQAAFSRSKVEVDKDSAPGAPGHKHVEIQLFTTAGYVTVTGNVVGTATALRKHQNLDWLAQLHPKFRELDGAAGAVGVLPIGIGDAPTIAHVVAAVDLLAPTVRAAIFEADWTPLLPKDTGSASEAFYRVLQHVYRAANGHGAVALEYLLHETNWGVGLVEGSADPAKYSRRSWVTGELKRIASKASTVNAAKGFSPVAGDWTCPELEQSQAAAAAAAPAMATAAPAKAPAGRTFADVFAEWRERGPLVHEPTGIAWLDDQTEGGIPHGERVIINGAPDAGKTLFLVELADSMLARGVFVAFHAVDETDSDVVKRFVQRRGLSRQRVDKLDGIDDIAAGLAALPFLAFGPEHTIEQVAAAAAEAADGRAVLVLTDSLHAVDSNASRAEPGMNQRDRVTAAARALRVVTRYPRMIAVATAEMNRSSYANSRTAGDQNAMASGAESRAIEFEARLLLTVKRTDSQTVEIVAAKNKLGGHNGARLHLVLDQAAQRLRPTPADFTAPDPSQQGVERKRARVAIQAQKDAAALARVLAGEGKAPSVRRLRKLASKAHEIGVVRFDDALAELGDAVEVRKEGAAHLHYLLGSRIPKDVLAHVPEAELDAVTKAGETTP